MPAVPPFQSGLAPGPLLGGTPLGAVTNQDPAAAKQNWLNAHQNPTFGWTENPVNYGGYAGGYQDTAAWLAHLQQQAQTQQAPGANFGQANGYMGDQYQTALSQNQNLAAMKSQLGGLEKQAAGGWTPADTALNQGVAASQAAGQSLASRAAPGAAWSGAERMAAGAGSAAAGQGANDLAQQRYNERMAANAELTQAQQAYQGALSGARTGALGAAGQYASQAQFNPGMQLQQNQLNAEAGYQGEANLLGLNQTNQTAQIQQQENEWNYGLAEQGYGMQANALAQGAVMGGASGGLSALGMAIQSNQQGGASG